MTKTLFILLAFSLVMVSCTDANDQAESSQYYDISTFFDEYADLLNSRRVSANKVIEKDGEREERFLENPDWKKELDPFKDLNIRRPAFRGEFVIDTVFSSAKNYSVKYISKSTKTEIREIEILFSNDEIQSLTASKMNDNAVFSISRNLAWMRNKGYRITGRLNIGNIHSTQYKIQGNYSGKSNTTGL
jgi:hypothetical protein